MTAKARILNLRLRLLPHRFIRNQNGTVAIEFGLIALPFFALLFAILETSIVFLASQALDTVVANSARLILTGQAQNGGINSASTFKTAVCNNVTGLLDCAGKLQVDVRKFSNFGAINLPPPTLTDGNLTDASSQFQQSVQGDIVVVRLFYQFPAVVPGFIPFLNKNLVKPDGKYMLVATAAFRNEPY